MQERAADQEQPGGKTVLSLQDAAEEAQLQTATMRSVSLHLLPLFFSVALLCNLDRANLAFAAPQLNADLGFSKRVYGFGSGVFFIGYALFQVPGTMLCARIGTPLFLGVSLVAWGAVATMFATLRSALQFYIMRFVLGLAETAAYPAMWYHLSQFYDPTELGLAFALVTSAAVLNNVVGGPIAGLLLSFSGLLGLRGWQWLFLLEGIPTVGMGLLIMKRLARDPGSAHFLDPVQRTWLVNRQARVAREQAAKARVAGQEEAPWWAFATEPRTWHVALVWALDSVALDALQFWGPAILQAVLYERDTAGNQDERRLHRAIVVACVSAIPFSVAACSMIVGLGFSPGPSRSMLNRFSCRSWKPAVASQTPRA